MQFHQHVNTTRPIVGRSLQYRHDRILVNTVLESVKGCELLATLVRDGDTLHSDCIRSAEKTHVVDQ